MTQTGASRAQSMPAHRRPRVLPWQGTEVQQGQYYLSAILPDGSGTYWRDKNTGNLYSVVVGLLCTVQIGTVQIGTFSVA